MATEQRPEPFVLRWGIVGTGLIASWFVGDLVRYPNGEKSEDNIKHVIQAVASCSSIEKAESFAQKHLAGSGIDPQLYDSYDKLYADPNVDIVYIATPHTLHNQNALDSIKAGKHVLCEKPMAVNAKQAQKMVVAARERGVFLMEAVWTRFFPLVKEFQKLIHVDKAIGTPKRAVFDFGLDMPIDKAPAGSRLRDVRLGAGSLLDIGIYPITWAALALHQHPSRTEHGADEEQPVVTSSLTLNGGADEISTVVLNYPKGQAQAICSSTYLYQSAAEFGRVEGTEGSIHVSGLAASKPGSLILKRKGEKEIFKDFEFEGFGFFYEADAVARDIRVGRKENETMPLAETLRVLTLIDRVRQQNGLIYPQDDE
ncbi:NAD(P)-binding protein [Cucurbitaria berberidis CBS 394.84]|uniref:D-xylose 1-dehydrogenase (NADP(+), D-xylono-1,5-lactone-forming) n=1 Tax=Cucurbitaria berberidis CBS 394.84 TaxID=1168544 RepID=A0A9P4GP43_9PLEO|nr:NAD(P)-binding protein [Cucurbitaria berberidis CBS 394.84]KAF1850048.1 NAD(P)-binding protein [Cucurbitaria berberidis CBS 394.84]